ncbi:hypothetical protein KQI58_01865 [Enterococcus raffinosus]|uniref:MSCRAMM family protein n=1 Tax=Enterococcus raffinosus TaxID=71452 RepID=UPI001C0F4E63|nr:SpaA isopeptide-forming pilin-related protein [Enterococcus raffinosus]MBU5359821.1 hypothetical protein [Enterococcus raffinosus]
MRKTKTVHLLMLLLLVSSYIVTLGTVRPVSSTAAKDITHLVDITGLKMKKDNGSEVTEDNKINISDTIHLEYSWEVSEANMSQVEAGDSFTVSLPDPEYFGGYSDEGPYDLENPYGENSLGTFKLEGNNFIVTINEEGASQTVLRDGWLTVDVKALKAGTEIDGGGNGSTNIPKLYIIDPGGGENPGGDDEEYPEESLPFRKDGKQNFGENSINWSFIVNYQGLQELINTYSANKAAGTETKIVPRENSLLIDKLDPGMKFQEDSLYVTVPVQTITTSGKMGTRLVKNTNNLQVQSEFERIYPEDGESYETFMNRVRNSPATNNQRAYGVYTDSENRDTVLVAFGDLPGDHAEYNDVHTGAIANAIASDDTLNDMQKSDLQNIYCDPNESPGGGGIVAYGLSFTADVLVGEGYGNGTYANKAQFIWGDDGLEEDEWETEFQRIGGGVASDFIQAEKEVEGTGELIEPRHFEFEIVEKENPETAIAYGITSEKISQKGKRIKIDFYKQKDANGNYTEKISGNEGANGWGSVMVDGHSYLIKEVGSPEYSSMITGGTGEGDQYDYNAQINKATQFLILNRSTINLQAKKKITGTAELTAPVTFTFQLKNQDNPVAYGKTVVDQKDKEYLIDFYTSPTFEEETKIDDWKNILSPGERYTLEEITANGYHPTYSHRNGESGEFNPGNTFTVDDESQNTLHFLVENNKEKPKAIKVSLEAKKELIGRELKDEEFDFELYDSTGQLLETKTNNGSSITFASLPFDKVGTHTYTIKEKVGTENGMNYDQKTVTATIVISEAENKLESTVTYTDDDGQENSANEFINTFSEIEPIEVSLEAHKSLMGRELKDEEFDFELYDSSGQLLETKTNNGTAITFSPLPFDEVGTYTYTIKEKAGDENGMNYDPKTVTAAITISKKDDQLESQITYVDDDGQENTVNMFINVYNEEPPTGGFCIRKVDNETNEPLANAVFHVFDSENQRVKEDEIIKTDEDGVVRVDGLPFGDYYAVEADPPEGYQIEDEPMKVSIHEESHEERNIVTNRDPKIQTGITLTKIDSVTKKKLQGAEFELKDALNASVDLGRKLITDENGLIHIDSLPAGEYSLVEIKAPTGYKLDSEPLKFTITKENKLVDLTKENTVELVPDKKVTPTAMPTEQKKSTPTAQTSSASTSKQYPKLNMWENVVLAILGWSVLGGLWLYLKKR